VSGPREDAGKLIAHFRITGTLGAGGMGVVYRARDEQLARDVALKLLPPELTSDPAARARLLREARLASALAHPGICAVYEVGEDRGQLYIAMELIDGRPLDERIPPHGLPPPVAIDYGIQIAAALAHAHASGVIHRDLKSANVMVAADGRVRVLDFGIAKLMPGMPGATAGALTTTTGVMQGTPQYMAPELLRGEAADARTDLWSLGVVLFEMAAGALPFRGETGFELGAAILNAEPLPLPASLPAGLRAVIARCLAKDPARRYQQAVEVRAALEMVRGEPGASSATPAAPPAAAPPRGPRSRLATIAAILIPVLALLALALDQGGVRTRLVDAARRLTGGRAGSERVRSLAVLPLENLSRDPDQEFFADGMTDELITRLAGLEGVRVISRTSTMRYKGTTKGIPQIGRELGVDAVIEGSALRAGGRVRITAQLIQAAQDRHLWAQSYERDMSDVLALQGEVAGAIAGEIRATLNPDARARAAAARRVSPEAYDAYLKGRFLWSRRDAQGIRGAVAQFQRAVAIDSSYALGWAGLASAYVLAPSYADAPAVEAFARARNAAARALALDSTLSDAHAALAEAKLIGDWDWKGAGVEFRRALEINPKDATAHHWYSNYLSALGRKDEALDEMDRAQALDPLSLITRCTRGTRLWENGREEEAFALLRDVIQRDPSFEMSYLQLNDFYESSGNLREAVLWGARFDSLSGMPPEAARRAMAALDREGPRGYYREELRWLDTYKVVAPPPSTIYAHCYLRLGDRRRALDMLKRSIDRHEDDAMFLRVSPWFEPLRSDPEFKALLARIGLGS
jgi:TolB-like protein/predicted Ser/Thr protein kinase